MEQFERSMRNANIYVGMCSFFLPFPCRSAGSDDYAKVRVKGLVDGVLWMMRSEFLYLVREEQMYRGGEFRKGAMR